MGALCPSAVQAPRLFRAAVCCYSCPPTSFPLGRSVRPCNWRASGLPRPCGLLQAAGLHAAAPLAFAALLGAQVRGFARSGFSACPVCACWVLRINRRHTIRVSCCRRHAFGVGGLVARYACACDRRAPLQGSYLVYQGSARPRAADVLADYPCGGGTRQPHKGVDGTHLHRGTAGKTSAATHTQLARNLRYT